MSKKLKLCAFILAVMMVFSMVLAGCGAAKEDTSNASQTTTKEAQTTAAQTVAEKPVIKILVIDDGRPKWSKDTLFIKFLSDAAEAVVEPVAIPYDVYKDKINTLIASRDFPDVMNMDDMYRQVSEYGTYGLFYDLSPFIKDAGKMPNLNKLVSGASNFYNLMTSSDGKIYGIPKFLESPFVYMGPVVSRKVLLDNNLDYLKDLDTLDDLTNYLRLAKKANGGTPPFITRSGNALVEYVAPMFGTDKKMYYNPENDKYQLGPLDDNYKKMVSWMAGLYKEGLLNKEAWQDSSKFDSYIFNKHGWFFIDNLAPIQFFVPEYLPDRKAEKTNYLQPIMSPKVDGKRYYAGNYFSTGKIDTYRIWSVSATTKHIDNIIKMLDWAYSEEGNQKLIYGIEGETFTKDKDGQPWWVFHFDQKGYDGKAWTGTNKDEGPKYNIITEALGWWNGGNVFYFKDRERDLMPRADLLKDGTIQFGDVTQLSLDFKKWLISEGAFRDQPILKFTPEEGIELKGIEATIDTFVEENVYKFIFGGREFNDSEWSSFTSEVSKMKADRLVEIYNAEYDKYKQAGK
ncbi:MAG: extracellular solute-binding protein [Ruminiclostridium sp.]|nr:extracellular solute-binding protein [Ruminiclostridium sp.]